MLQEKHNVPAPEEGLYVVFVSLHVKTEENTKKNNRKKRKKRSFRSDKTQIKMELCGTDKCKPNRSGYHGSDYQHSKSSTSIDIQYPGIKIICLV